MKLFGKGGDGPGDATALAREIEDVRERLVVLTESIKAMFVFIREYTLDIADIDAETFKTRLERLEAKFHDAEKAKTIAAHFNGQKAAILKHIQRQRAYLDERETEFREIIDLMTAALAGMDSENQDFYGNIRSQGERFEEITRLDDIKRIKSELLREVEKMRAMVRDKESTDQKSLDALSSQVDTLKKELDEARQSANTDGLTGVKNRKALDNHLKSLVDRNSVTRSPFSLLMMDIDDFKKLNDTYGHTVGDRMLVAFTEKCRSSVRSDDFLARYGGEEFTLILPGASLRNAAKKGKQLCRSIAASRYAADDSPNPDAISITVSIGVSAYRKGDTVESVVDRADRCLYKAKADGKNRVVAENAL
jgi:diguanylate cyclase